MGDPLVRRIANANVKPNKIQSKFLNANVTSNGVLTALSFNNLQIGKVYEITGLFVMQLDVGGNDDAISVDVRSGATIIQSLTFNLGAPDAQTDQLPQPVLLKFTAIGTTLTFTAADLSASSYLIGTGGGSGSYIQLEERNDIVDTTDFT